MLFLKTKSNHELSVKELGTPFSFAVSMGRAHAIMRFVYRIEIIDALTRSEACAKPIVHLFESRLSRRDLPLTGFPCRLTMRLLGLNFIYWQYLSSMSNRENGYLFGFDTINDAVIAVN